MGIKTYNPYTPSRRNMTGSDFSEITKTTPEKSLVVSLKKNAGRNNQGKIIYKRYRDGVPVDEEEKAICEQIDDRMAQVDKYKEEMDGVKGNRFCPSCGNPIGRNDAFCSRCGAACPIPEPEEEAGDTVDGTAEEIYETEETSEEVDVTDGTEETGSKVSLSKEETVQGEVSESEANEVPEKEDSVQEEKTE